MKGFRKHVHHAANIAQILSLFKGVDGMGTKPNQHQINEGIKALVLSKDTFTQEEKKVLRMYSGSGGQGKNGAKGIAEILYEFYTPGETADVMYELAYKYGFKDGKILEPSCGTGELIRPAKDYKQVTAFEINPVSAKIAKILYPGINLHGGYFETAFLQEPRFTKRCKPFSWLASDYELVIGNPPFGKNTNTYSSYFPTPKFAQVEMFFIYYAMQLLKKDGLLVYMISSNFLRNGNSYNDSKATIGKIADIVDAYRLPPVMTYTEVPVDIIVLRKK
jgi:hypothetical protein